MYSCVRSRHAVNIDSNFTYILCFYIFKTLLIRLITFLLEFKIKLSEYFVLLSPVTKLGKDLVTSAKAYPHISHIRLV